MANVRLGNSRQEVADLIGIDLKLHDSRMESADPPVGQFIRQINGRIEEICGHTEAEHKRLALIADEAALVMGLDLNIDDLETEFQLQVLENDFYTIERRPVNRPRHKAFPRYIAFDDDKFM